MMNEGNIKEVADWQIPSTTLSVPSKTILLEGGRIARKIYLIRKGCLRLFFYHEGKDITFQFFFEGDFVASFDSMHKHSPSLFYLQSIEASELTVIKGEDFYRQIEKDASLRQLYEDKLVDRFSTYQQLFLSRIKNTPQQRYDELLREQSQYHQAHSSALHRILSRHHARIVVAHQKSSLSRISLQLLSSGIGDLQYLCSRKQQTNDNEEDFCNRQDAFGCLSAVRSVRHSLSPRRSQCKPRTLAPMGGLPCAHEHSFPYNRLAAHKDTLGVV